MSTTVNDNDSMEQLVASAVPTEVVITTNVEHFERLQDLAKATCRTALLFTPNVSVESILAQVDGHRSIFIDSPPDNKRARVQGLVGKLPPEKVTAFVELYVPALDEVGLDQALASAKEANHSMVILQGESRWAAAVQEILADKHILETDLGNEARFIIRHGSRFIYSPAIGWLVWTEHRWAPLTKEALQVAQAAKSTVMRIEDEVQFLDNTPVPGGSEQYRRARWAKQSQNRSRIAAVVDLAAASLEVEADALDANQWLLNCRNQTLNLRTGKLQPHNPLDRITKLTAVDYDPDATCPLFLKFLDEITLGRPQLVEFLQRFLGHCLTGDASEHVFIIMWGEGFNGKSVLLKTIRGLMGDYAANASAETFLAQRQERIRNDIARLKGVRFVTTSETGEGAPLNEPMVKLVTGEDSVTSRFLFKEEFEYVPQFKAAMATNNKPIIRGTDNAIWGRVKLVPFELNLKESERDKELTKKLRAEWPGILAWMVRGCLMWQKDGLKEPKEITQATSEYREQQDTFGRFLEDCCEQNYDFTEKHSNLMSVYTQWCKTNNSGYAFGSVKFGAAMQKAGFARIKDEKGIRGHGWAGVRLNEEGRDILTAEEYRRNRYQG